MRRLTWNSCIFGVVVAASALSTPHLVNASPRMISVVYNSSLRSPHQIGSDAFVEKLLAVPGRHFVVDQRAGNALGSESTILSGVRSGAVDVAVVTSSVVSAVVPEMGVFDIPFLFRDEKQAKAVMQGPAVGKIAVKFLDKGLVLLALGKQGFRELTNSKHPIETPSDLKGLRIRVIPNETYLMTFKALGADVVPMDFPLVYAALKDGRLDGQENPPAIIASNHFNEVQKYMTLTDHFFAPIAFVANRAMFEQLDVADQEALTAAAKEGAEATWKTQLDASSLQDLRGAGMEVTDKIDRQAFVDAVKPLDPEFEKRFGKDLIATIRSTH